VLERAIGDVEEREGERERKRMREWENRTHRVVDLMGPTAV